MTMSNPPDEPRKIKVTFLPSVRRVEVPSGTSIYEAAISAGMNVRGECGGKGLCGKCRVRLLGGSKDHVSDAIRKHFAEEELTAGMTLACQSLLLEDSTVEMEEAQIARDAKGDSQKGYERLDVESNLRKIYLVISPPSFEDQASDLERVGREIPGIREIGADLWTLSVLPDILRQSEFRVTAVLYGDYLLGVESGDTTAEKYAVAFDLGTTTVAGFLLDLNSGETLVSSHTTNYQQIFGADVISRINYTIEHKDGGKLLQKRIILAMNDIIFHLLKESGISKDRVYEVMAAGNTTMIHLMLGLKCEAIARSPFVPVFSQPINMQNRDFGLNIHSNGIISTLPTVAGFLGSDIIAAMLATNMDGGSGSKLLIDLGTNGEIVLSGKGRILACSTAAGPAFEGAAITCGMRAVDGAIENILISGDVHLDVIGNVAPVGICGSGLVGVASEMLRSGILLSDGRIVDREALKGRFNQKILNCIQDGANGKEFVLSKETSSATGGRVRITQLDIRKLQLAKGAICAGIEILLDEMGIKGSQINQIFLAGAFGNYINKENAVSIGLIPAVPLERIHPVGNAAGEGARMALASTSTRRKAIDLARTVEYIELANHKEFREIFINATYFPSINPEKRI